MNKKRKPITKEILMNLGVTNVSKYGTVYYKGEPKPTKVVTLKHKYGKDVEYPVIILRVPERYRSEVFMLSRVVYAWFNEDCPADMDVDHIDNNPFNNNIDNLQLLTHEENIKKRGIGKNQFSYNLTDEEIIAKRKAREESKKLVTERESRIKYLKKQLASATELWHREVAERNQLGIYYAKELMEDIKTELKELRSQKHKTNKEN